MKTEQKSGELESYLPYGGVASSPSTANRGFTNIEVFYVQVSHNALSRSHHLSFGHRGDAISVIEIRFHRGVSNTAFRINGVDGRLRVAETWPKPSFLSFVHMPDPTAHKFMDANLKRLGACIYAADYLSSTH